MIIKIDLLYLNNLFFKDQFTYLIYPKIIITFMSLKDFQFLGKLGKSLSI